MSIFLLLLEVRPPSFSKLQPAVASTDGIFSITASTNWTCHTPEYPKSTFATSSQRIYHPPEYPHLTIAVTTITLSSTAITTAITTATTALQWLHRGLVMQHLI